MRYSYGCLDDFDAIVDELAEGLPDELYPMTSQKRMTATLLEASARLEQMDRRRLQIDLLDIATKLISGDSYAWPRPRLE